MTDTIVDFQRSGPAAILRIHGEITGGSEPELMAAYAKAEGARSVVLDFSDLDYMNSGGIGLLVTLLVRARRAGQQLMAVGLSDHYRQILALTRLDEAIAIHDTTEAALAAVG
jgi:anti-sigma B factor antagonist